MVDVGGGHVGGQTELDEQLSDGLHLIQPPLRMWGRAE